MQSLVEIYYAISAFLERGGDVLVLISAVIFLMWLLILDRFLYLVGEYPQTAFAELTRWQQRRHKNSWQSQHIYRAIVSRLTLRAERGMDLLRTLATISPLLGLLGTVTGMIVIFDVMGFLPNTSPRAVAGGVSRATVTTMAGMVAALSGYFPAIWLQRLAKSQLHRLRSSHAVRGTPDKRPGRLPPACRYFVAPLSAAAITCALLFGMEQMILLGKAATTEGVRRFQVDFIRIAREATPQTRDRAPEKPPDASKPPDLTFDPPSRSTDGLAVAAPLPSAPGNMLGFHAAGPSQGLGGFVRDGEYLPIVKVEPVYPTRALARRLEGWVMLRFTVTTTGAVRDIEVVESTDVIFEPPAIEAAGRFKYRPRIIDGQPIEVPGVLNKIAFVMAR